MCEHTNLKIVPKMWRYFYTVDGTKVPGRAAYRCVVCDELFSADVLP